MYGLWMMVMMVRLLVWKWAGYIEFPLGGKMMALSDTLKYECTFHMYNIFGISLDSTYPSSGAFVMLTRISMKIHVVWIKKRHILTRETRSLTPRTTSQPRSDTSGFSATLKCCDFRKNCGFKSYNVKTKWTGHCWPCWCVRHNIGQIWSLTHDAI